MGNIFSHMFWACAVCFGGDPKSAPIIGLKWGVLSLLIVLLFVLGLFAAFLINFNKRSKNLKGI